MLPDKRGHAAAPATMRSVLGVAILAAWAIGSAGCTVLGFSNRVVWRLRSPDGQMFAVCQEIPEFDGPGYAIRLERPDGSVLRHLYRIGDGDPCSEMAWSPDGRVLAVLSGHVARVRFVDVSWALSHPATTKAYWSWRQVDFGSEQRPMNGAALHFVGPLEVELRLCPPPRGAPQPNDRRTCGEGAAVHRFDVPLPMVTGRKALSLIASPALGRQTARFEITPDTVLLDERFQITLDGMTPGQDVTIRMDGNRGVWQSSATFRSDDRGRMDVADPMRFIWSAKSTRPPAGVPGQGAQPLTFTVEADGRVIATQTILRRALAETVRMAPVREHGLVGMAYYPPGAGPHPAMIVLPGSLGGIPGPAGFPGGLASRGYVVLALAYFNAEGLPPLLQNIPLEYFATAVEWLKSQPSVDAIRIGVLGTSRGGELALLLGATYPSAFRVVVANVPSNVVWPGLSDDSETPAWTLKGKPLPSVPSHFTVADRALSGRERFLKRLQNAARAEIAVERIDAPVLMFSGKDDQLWPSDIFAARVVERLKAHHFKHPVEHYSYENAGHQIARPFVPTTGVREVNIHPVSKRPNMAGGTPEGQARANEDSWEKLLAFLDKYLRNAP